MTVLSASAGSGKTVLLRSWISEPGVADYAAWVPVERGDQDPQQFWLSVLDELRGTVAGSTLVRALTAAPDLDGWAIVERLLTDLAPLEDRLWLVIDDLHELGSEARRQLELLVMRAPPALRFVLATRRDVRLGLHRLRLEGELTEIRADELRFTVAEAQALFQAAGVQVFDLAVKSLVYRTEGWVAGLRLAALSLAGHSAPERFAVEFSGSERTVSEYLLAEVLDRQPADMQRLLLRTSVLERVNGELADLLTGGSGGERVLQDLAGANAFVVPLDAARSWFRYHHLFGDLLRLELRRTEPGEAAALHEVAAAWFAEHQFPVEAIRHAQAAHNWRLASRLLVGYWPALYLDGQAVTVRTLMAEFPQGTSAAEAELATVAAADQLSQGSLDAAERYLLLAERGAASVPAARRGQASALLGVVRLLLAWLEGNLPTLSQQAHRLQDLPEAPESVHPGLGELRALALVCLGDIEIWTGRLDQAESHPDEVVTLARRIERPYLEFTAMVYQAEIELSRWFPRAAERSRQAVDLAEEHGWTDETTAGLAYNTLGSALAWQGRLEEAAGLGTARRAHHQARSCAGVGDGSPVRPWAARAGPRPVRRCTGGFPGAERLARRLPWPHPLVRPMRAWLLHTFTRLGDFTAAEQVLSGLGQHDRDRGEMRIAAAVLRIAQGAPQAAAAELAPVLDETARVGWRSWLVEAFLLEAIARDAPGDPAAAGEAVERALDLAEPDGALLWFLLHPTPSLLERQARQRTAHAALIAEILILLAGAEPASRRPGTQLPFEPLSGSELRVRYLPTHLSVPEIAAELSVSPSTVKSLVIRQQRPFGTPTGLRIVGDSTAWPDP